MVIMVVDGQGGGIGKALIERLKTAVGAEHELIAVGTNAMATMGMMISSVMDLVMVEKAAPMMVPTASAIALPLMAKATNSSHQLGFLGVFTEVLLSIYPGKCELFVTIHILHRFINRFSDARGLIRIQQVP